MPTYVTLLRYTDQGVRNIKDSPARIDAGKKMFQAAGAELKAWYLTLGRYDAIAIGDAPNDETAAKLALQLGALGNVHTETMRVFTESEFRKMIAALT
jgi:uncharacterized protein with GYD domain